MRATMFVKAMKLMTMTMTVIMVRKKMMMMMMINTMTMTIAIAKITLPIKSRGDMYTSSLVHAVYTVTQRLSYTAAYAPAQQTISLNSF